MTAEGEIEYLIPNEEDFFQCIKGENCQEGGDEAHDQQEEATITYHTIASTPTPNSMRVKEKIGGRDVVILINIGATHSFVSTEIAQSFRVRTKEYPVFDVAVGDDIRL